VGAGMRACWRSFLRDCADCFNPCNPRHPIVRLELQRIRRKRWWPGRRLFLFYPVLLGAALGCGLVAALGELAGGLPGDWDLLDPVGSQVAALVAGVPSVCLVNVLAWLLAFILPWMAPALTAPAIARERELGTLDLLRVTLLSERSIVLGKLGACLLRLWPGLLTLALLAPFQLVWVAGAGLTTVSDPMALLEAHELNLEWSWMGLLAASSLIGLVRPWGDLAFHAAIGLFASAVARSSGVAVAAAYAVAIAARMFLWLGRTLFSTMGTLLWFDTSLSNSVTGLPGLGLGIPVLLSAGTLLVDVIGAAVLIWAATWWLKRT